MASMDDIPRPVIRDLLKAMLRVQEQRAEHYTTFAAKFKQYTVDRNDSVFQESVKQTTAAFGACSLEVRQIEGELKGSCGRDDLAAILRAIQVRSRSY